MKNVTKTFIMLAVIIALSTACANQATGTPVPAVDSAAAPEGVVAEGRLEPARAANLTFQTRGVVEEVYVQIGDSVQKDDVLARLSSAGVAEAQVAAANLELIQAQQALDALNRNGSANLASAWTAYMNAQIARAEAERDWEALNVDDIEDRIEDAKADLEDLEEDLQDAKDEFEKYKDLDKDNSRRVTAEDDLETAQEEYDEAIRNLEEIMRERDTVRAALDAALAAEAEAKYQYEISADGVNAEALALAAARLENAQAQVAAAEANLSGYVITAPFDGVVVEAAVEAGEQVSPETRIVSLADTSAWVVETTDVTELEVVQLSVGQNVTFTADALPGVEMTGVVTEISGSSILLGGDVIYTVRIAAEEVDSRVKWGMTVEVVFEPVE
ncbi:MAG: efflux RND transporter periplasmic adaptor subunit [Chloroflexota bacterium]